MDDAFYDPVKQRESEAALMAWLARYAARLRDDPLTPEARRTRMYAANPRYVLRNYLAQQAIDRAEQGDDSAVAAQIEEHTSEPPSLMRTSYAVFCSKKTQKLLDHYI